MKSIELQDSLLVLKDELYVDRLSGFSFRTKYDSLKKEVSDIESQIRQLNEGLDSLNRLLQRFVMFNLFPNSFLLGQFLHSFIFSFRGSLLFHLSLFAVCSIIISSFWATRLMFLAILSGGFIIFCHHYHHYDVFFFSQNWEIIWYFFGISDPNKWILSWQFRSYEFVSVLETSPVDSLMIGLKFD